MLLRKTKADITAAVAVPSRMATNLAGIALVLSVIALLFTAVSMARH